MAILEIVKYPDPRLKKVSTPVTKIDTRIKTLLADMAETMYAAPGIGLAAPQVGVNERVIVLDLGSDEEEDGTPIPARLYKIVNPEIVSAEGETEYEEGCLSIPSIKDVVTRSEKIVVRGLNEHSEPIEIAADGLLAICLQHEIDHLDGILFIDRLSAIKRNLIKAKLAKRLGTTKKS